MISISSVSRYALRISQLNEPIAVILSPIASQERPQYRGMEEVTGEEDTYLRIFGKPYTRVNRRMGVVLCYAPNGSDLDALRDKAKRIADKVEVY